MLTLKIVVFFINVFLMQQRFGITDQKVNVSFKSRILNKITHFEQARANSKKTQHDALANIFTITLEKIKFLQERKNNNYNTEKPTLTLEYKSKCNVKNFENQWERRFQQ